MIPIERLMTRYKLGKSTIIKILTYDTPERKRVTRAGRPSLLTDRQVDEIIKYASESWDHRAIDYTHLNDELELECSVETIERRLKQQGYFWCTACQKPYLTAAQVIARLLWVIAHIF
jgi:transposase